MRPLLFQLLTSQGLEIKFKQEPCVMKAQGLEACNPSGPKKMGVRGYVPALARVQKVVPDTVPLSQAKNSGTDKCKAGGYQYPR